MTYKILTGLDLAGTGDNSGAYDFVFNAPAGYTVVDYGPETGPQYTTGQDYVYVQFALAPEPSTYALIGLGLPGLVVVRRFRRLSAQG